jgi:hypothetical protein
MKTQHNSLTLVGCLLLLAALISGCQMGTIHIGNVRIGETRIGMFGSNGPGEMSYTYTTFSGYESQQATVEVAGQTLALDYEVVVTKGSLRIEVQDPSGTVIWSETLSADSQDTVDIPAEAPGEYLIAVQAEGAGGSFRLAWQVK